MRYRLFLYSTTAAGKNAPAVKIINRNLRCSFPDWDKGNEPEHFMQRFDTSRVTELIRSELSSEGSQKCDIIEKSSPKEKMGYLCIETDFETVESVWPSLVKVALKEQLVLLDAQINKYEFEPDGVRYAWRNITLRIMEVNEQIKQKTEGIWQLRRIYKENIGNCPEAAYVLTLQKYKDLDLLDRIKAFNQLLLSLLVKGEKLVCKDECFTIQGTCYSISYVVEAYKKNANRICYMLNGYVHVDILHRICCEKAFKWIRNNPGKRHHETYNRIIERLFFTEMVYKYPNPADRFCASLNISKALMKEKLDVDYSSFEYFGSDIMFHRVPNDFCLMPEDCCRETISALKIEEEPASFLLPFVIKEYPDFYDRYYLTDNHIPAAMLKRIRDRVAEARDQLRSGTNLQEFVSIFERANYFALDDNLGFFNSNDPAVKTGLIEKYRFTIAHLYDIFIQWVDLQLEYGDEDDLFNITGP